MQHLDEGTIHAWLDGALDDAESARVEAHTATCADCAAMVADARGVIAGATRIVSMLDGVRGGVIPDSVVRPAKAGSLWGALRVTPARAALAASLMIATATLFAVRHDTPDKMVPHPMEPPRTTSPMAPSVVTEMKSTKQHVDAGRGAKPATRSDSAPESAATPVVELPQNQPPSTAAVVRPAPAMNTAKAADATAVEDSLRLKTAPTPLNNEARAFAANRAASGASSARFQEIVTAAAPAPTLSGDGCYRLAGDSAHWPRLIPTRFALVQDTSTSTRRNVLRAVAGNGQLDSVVAGSNWQRVSPTVTHLTLATAHDAETMTMLFTANGTVLSYASGRGRSQTVPIARADCSP